MQTKGSWRDITKWLWTRERFLLLGGNLYRRTGGFGSSVEIRGGGQAPLTLTGSEFRKVRFFRRPKTYLNAGDYGILIPSLFRFGNAVEQIVNAVLAAEHFGACQVIFGSVGLFPRKRVELASTITLVPANPIRGFNRKTPEFVWRSDCFVAGRPFPEWGATAQTLVGAPMGESMRENVEPLNPREETLVIHVRSGDIFSTLPHSDYGQPPLSFYITILQSRFWQGVRIVAEDDVNPVVGRIQEWCEAAELPCEVVGENFVDAVREIAQADHLVTSRGTFVPAILLLFSKKKTIYGFSREPVSFCEDPLLTVRRIVDVDGEYVNKVLAGNWRNDAKQRELMVSYPESSLTWLAN